MLLLLLRRRLLGLLWVLLGLLGLPRLLLLCLLLWRGLPCTHQIHNLLQRGPEVRVNLGGGSC